MRIGNMVLMEAAVTNGVSQDLIIGLLAFQVMIN